jgi:hypothetical protein
MPGATRTGGWPRTGFSIFTGARQTSADGRTMGASRRRSGARPRLGPCVRHWEPPSPSRPAGGSLAASMAVMTVFALGSATSLLAAGFGLGRLATGARNSAALTGQIGRGGLGIAFALVGAAILTGIDHQGNLYPDDAGLAGEFCNAALRIVQAHCPVDGTASAHFTGRARTRGWCRRRHRPYRPADKPVRSPRRRPQNAGIRP